ncbi:MAG: hypothetical protein AB7F22_25500 [Reyranella sp.]|uniref:hypothetical protein n=1 Tax=Reyranella sp. TaxID=1929291 RepID=UPI003D0A0C38
MSDGYNVQIKMPSAIDGMIAWAAKHRGIEKDALYREICIQYIEWHREQWGDELIERTRMPVTPSVPESFRAAESETTSMSVIICHACGHAMIEVNGTLICEHCDAQGERDDANQDGPVDA